MLKADFLYDLPENRIALFPSEPRDSCRLLVIHKDSGKIEHRSFADIVEYFGEGDALVLNDSRVHPVRFRLSRSSGGIVEFLLTHRRGEGEWVALARPSKRLKAGEGLLDERGEGVVSIIEKAEGHVIVKINLSESDFFSRFGLAPLPAYIQRVPEKRDIETYQTVYAHDGFSIAAPTAGLHFTPHLLERLKEKGVSIVYIQLDVGEGTFRPITADKIEDHKMLSENYAITTEAAEKINRAGRVVAVGTTVTRTLESFLAGPVTASSGSTDLFIYPGHEFRHVDVLLTNFHQPGSTPLVLTSAFCGKELLFKAYGEALGLDYRFLSYGDAMIILPFDFDEQNRREPELTAQKKTSFSFGDPISKVKGFPGTNSSRTQTAI